MGSYNILVATLQCPGCKNNYESRIQFKYGHTWQLEYHINDRLVWGGNEVGISGWPSVKVYGISETDNCPICNLYFEEDEFDIYIVQDLIKTVRPIAKMDDYFENEGNFKLL